MSGRRDIECHHFRKAVLGKSYYIYDLVGMDLQLCHLCEAKLRKAIVAQIKIDREINKDKRLKKRLLKLQRRKQE